MFAFRKNHRFNSPARLIPAIVLAAFFLAATTAEATTWYSRDGGGDWDDVSTWSIVACDGVQAANVPQADGDVVICDGDTVTVTTTTNSIDTLTVNNGGTLNMESVGGGTPSTGILVVQESITVEATGTFNFNESIDARPELRADGAGVALEGTFSVLGTAGALLSGSDETCSFAVDAGETVWFGGPLTNETTIVVNGGSLTFGGSTTNNGTITIYWGSLTFGGLTTNNGTIIAIGGSVAISAAMDNSETLVLAGSTVTISGCIDNNEIVVISGGTVTISGDIDNNGVITISGGTVTINGDIDNSGTITIFGGGPTISGDVDSSGTITACGGTITFSGDLENDGRVTASGGDITFSGTINAGSTGLFEVTAAASDMVFDLASSANLTGDGDFNIEAGRMWFKESLTTAGGYRQTGGKTEVAAGKTFTATGAY